MAPLSSVLNQPFPAHLALRYRVQITLGFSLFIIAFMLYFEPIQNVTLPRGQQTWIVLGYGLICFVMLGLDLWTGPMIFRRQIEEGNWKVYMHILAMVWLFIRSTAVILLFNYLLGISQFTISGFFVVLGNVVAITSIPAALVILILYNYELRLNLQAAQSMNEAVMTSPPEDPNSLDTVVTLSDSGEREILSLRPSDLVAVRSADNYVTVFWDRDGSTEKTLLRQTLTNVENTLAQHDVFYRTHRTCLVNLNKIRHIEGNSLGYSLILDGIDEKVPVSRDRGGELKDLLLKRTA